MRRIKKRLDRENSQLSVNRDFNVAVPFNQTNRLLPENEINRVVNQYDEFVKERNASYKYRFLGTIKTLFSNPLFEVSDSTNWGVNYEVNHWGVFDETRFTISTGSSDLTYLESWEKYLGEKDGWFGYDEPFSIGNASVSCEFKIMTPSIDFFTMTPKSPEKNWDLLITYPYTSDTTNFLVNDGLYIGEYSVITVGGRPMNALRTPTKHGLVPGDRVTLTGIDPITISGDVIVKQLGYEDGSFPDNVFVIDTELITNMVNGRMKKVMGSSSVDRFESRYYYRIFKTISRVGGYENYPLQFASNIYSDPVSQYIFNGGSGTTEDIDVSNYRDNLGRPLSELYVTIVKNNNHGFTNISSGIDIEYLEGIDSVPGVSDIHRIYSGGTFVPFPTHTPLEASVSADDDLFYGDVVEYNDVNLVETVLATVHHRFNTINRVEEGRPEGYYYQAHHRNVIREFSVFVETGYSGMTNIPDYYTDLGDGRWTWRDLLYIGFAGEYETAVDYPFSNGAHYIYNNIQLSLRRQDPFDLYGVYHTNGPNPDLPVDTRDPFGDPIDSDKYKINRGCNGC